MSAQSSDRAEPMSFGKPESAVPLQHLGALAWQ